MIRIRALLLPILALLAVPAAAQDFIELDACPEMDVGASFACARVGAVTAITDTEDAGVEVSNGPGADFALHDSLIPAVGGANERFVAAPLGLGSGSGLALRPAAVATIPIKAIAAYGPFRVIDATHAALVDVTDERSPAQFAALLRAHPGIATLELVECPGTEDDRGNLAVGRMIRARGIATHVPSGGSVRSGGVELFLAGARRSADEGAEFAVHSWMDDYGREPADYAANAPENRKYLEYYREMGMSPAQAAAFYAMTNSVRHEDAKWLTAADMRQWVAMSTHVVARLD